jgi:hypothetical protein
MLSLQVVRMYRTILGEAGFKKGMKLYFERHDGGAVTCDDFRAAMAGTCCIALHCTILYYTAVYCTELYCTALFCTVSCTVLRFPVLHREFTPLRSSQRSIGILTPTSILPFPLLYLRTLGTQSNHLISAHSHTHTLTHTLTRTHEYLDANNVDLSQFERWYNQAGTPIVEAKEVRR